MNQATYDRTQAAMRRMAWARAKGELYSMLETFATADDHLRLQYAALYEAIEAFVDRVEGDGLQE